MNKIKIVSSQTFWQLGAKVITSLSTFLILALVARNYGEFGTGIFTLSLTYLSFVFLIADFGVNAHILPILLKEEGGVAWQKVLGSRIIWSLLLIPLTGFLVFLWPGGSNDFRLSVWIGLPAIFGTIFYVSANAYFQAKLKYNLSFFAASLGAVVTYSAIFFLTSLKTSVPMLLLGQFMGWTFAGILALILVRRFTKIYPLISIKYLLNLFKDSWAISLTLIINILYFRADAFILSFYHGFSETGVYNLSYQVFQTALVIPVFIMNAYYPLLLLDLKKDIKLFSKNIVKSSLLMLLISLLGIGLTFILAPLVISLLTNNQGFAGSIYSLKVLSLAFPAFFLTGVLMWALIALKHYKIMLMIYSLGLITNFVLNLIFIPRYSYLAASWVTVISEYLILFLELGILFKLIKKASI